MSSTPSNLLRYLRVVAAAWRNDPRTDAELLVRFAQSQEEAAFATLVCRHGPLVWRTCLHILGNTQDTEDTFQATFLALAHKASQVPIKSLAGWLHRVARRAALDARAGARRRRGLEQRLRAVTQPKMEEDTDRAELYAALDEELAGLPERLRVPLLLHYLEGRSQVEVAHFLGCARRALQKRLARGEAILRERLERRGLTVGVVSVGALLASTVTAAAIPSRLIGSTAQAALRSLSFPLSESSKVAALAEGVMKTMVVTKVKLVTVLLGMALCLAGGGVLAYQALTGNAAEPLQAAGEVSGEVEGPRQPAAAARVDCYGDPLPAHALARMGTTRLYYYSANQQPSEALVFSPDGKILATNIDNMTVCLWDAVTGKEIRRLTTKAVKGWITSLDFSPDGKTLITQIQLATREDEEMVCWWEVATGKFLRKQQCQGPKRDKVDHQLVTFLPDGKMLRFVSFLKSVEKEKKGAYIWDGATGKEICQLNRPMMEGERVRYFSTDGKMLTMSMNNVEKKTIFSLWDVATGKEIRQVTYKDDCIHEPVAFSRDGKTLASATDTQNDICVLELATGKKIHLLKAEGANAGPLTFSPDGKTLVGGRTGHLWDIGTGKEIRSFGWRRAHVAVFSSDGKTLAVGDGTGAIRLWEVATGKEIGPRKGSRGPITSIAYSADGKTLASIGEGETVRLWEVATGKEMRSLAEHVGGGESLAYSPDGKMLVSIGGNVIHLWDTATGKEIRRFGEFENPKSAAFSPDGKRLAAILGDKTIHLWEVATGKEIYSRPTMCMHEGYAIPLAFSPDGQLLAAPGKEDRVSLWEVATGRLIGQLGRLKQPAQRNADEDKFVICSLAFSADGRMLAMSGSRGGLSDGKIHVWEVASGREICQLNGLKGTGCGCTLAFSPDSRILATASLGTDGNSHFDPKVHLWEIASGKELSQLTGHRNYIQTLAFSPDGKTLASGSRDLTCLSGEVVQVP